MKRVGIAARALVVLGSWVAATASAVGVPGTVGLAAPARTVHLEIAPPPPGRLPWVVFDERSGLPQHTIVDLLADQQGFVWAATQDGAARFDGRAWEPVPLPRTMGSNYPRTMRTARDGGLWIGSFDGGLAHLRDGAWTVYDTSAGLPSNRVRGLLETTDAVGRTVLWIATESGVARLVDGRISAFGLDSGLPSLDTEGLCEVTDAGGRRSLLVGTANGLARFDGTRFVPVPVPRQILGHRIGDIVETTGLGGGRAVWITSYGAGLGVLEGGTWTVLDTAAGLPSNVEVLTRSVADDGTPALWIGTEGGLVRFEHGRFTLFDERCGLPINIVWKVLETTAPDGQRTLWLGTWGGGVVRLSPHAWTAFDTTSGLPSGSVTAITVGPSHGAPDDGTIWAGTSDGELARFDGRRFVSVPLPAPLRHAIVFSLLATRDDDGGSSLWVGGFGGGVGRLKDGRWTMLDPALLPNPRVYKIVATRDADGSAVLWFCTEGGIARLAHGRATFFRKGVDLPSEIVTELLETTGEDGSRTVWAATSRGLARWRDGRWRTFDRDSGLLSQNVAALAVETDAGGVRWLWVGTFAGGAARARLDELERASEPGGKSALWQTFNAVSTPALPTDTVPAVAVGADRRIYLLTTRGVVRLTHAKDAEAGFAAELFTTDDGLPSGDCQQSARFVDAAGRVWVGTARGLAVLDPRRERPDRSPKPLVFERAVLSDGGRALRSGESLAWHERNLTFAPALLAYVGESRIRYRYQLDGFDTQPSEWTPSALKEYTNLGPGRYELRVWGEDAHGNVSGPTKLPFSVRPAPWLSPWAFAVYAALVAGAGYGGVQWRVRALARRTHELETVVAERTRELVLARDQLAQLAAKDGLTGIANRRVFDATLEQAWRRAERERRPLSLVLLDVDFFKRFNDRYGHVRGDACLQAVARVLEGQCRRAGDLAARYGGEEFALVLPETDAEGAVAVLRAILAGVDALALEHADSSAAPHVTVSLGGVTVVPGPQDDRQAALTRADHLLYVSKSEGRHRATHADGSAERRILAPTAP